MHVVIFHGFGFAMCRILSWVFYAALHFESLDWLQFLLESVLGVTNPGKTLDCTLHVGADDVEYSGCFSNECAAAPQG